MNINKFISKFENHPVLFVGTGMSLRYLENSYTWDGLLKKISKELTNNNEFYLDLKSKCYENRNDSYNYAKIATLLEKEFNEKVAANRDGKFKEINDIFYENMEKDINTSRFKIYISQILSNLDFKSNMKDELNELKKIRKNISSIITTNYDELIEKVFEFNPLIGNNILLSNPYGSIYKIHGCISNPNKIIVTEDDYKNFDEKYELIRAQLLSLFIHNPIIFIGYGIGDENIKKILKTIFTYVDLNSDDAKKIKNNFLLVQYDPDSTSEKITPYDIDMEPFGIININKIKTNNFKSIYSALSNLELPVSTMDIRKVQTVIKDIYSGGDIKVAIIDELDDLENKDKVLAIGSIESIKYVHKDPAELMISYFKIIEEKNVKILTLIDRISINSNRYFPMFGFSKINPNIECSDKLKKQQVRKIKTIKKNIKEKQKTKHTSIKDILEDEEILDSHKLNCIIWSALNRKIKQNSFKEYLKSIEDKNDTIYRKLLCVYDYIVYGDI